MILGAAGFIGTNLALALNKKKEYSLTLVDRSKAYFNQILFELDNVSILEDDLDFEMNFEKLVNGHDVVYHLVSTIVPSTSNQNISQELKANVIFTSNLLDACVKCGIKRVVFISSGGTVYGKEVCCPLKEETPTKPISSYGLQKITIERLLYLYRYMYGLDYRIIRLSNPYGAYQRPNGVLGAVTTFTYKALKNEKITVYGDGSVIRDFIYIDDAIKAIINIGCGGSTHRTFNVGCGRGASILEVLNTIENSLKMKLSVEFKAARKVDVPINYLDIGRYEEEFGRLNPISLYEGVKRTAKYMQEEGMV